MNSAFYGRGLLIKFDKYLYGICIIPIQKAISNQTLDTYKIDCIKNTLSFSKRLRSGYCLS